MPSSSHTSPPNVSISILPFPAVQKSSLSLSLPCQSRLPSVLLISSLFRVFSFYSTLLTYAPVHTFQCLLPDHCQGSNLPNHLRPIPWPQQSLWTLSLWTKELSIPGFIWLFSCPGIRWLPCRQELLLLKSPTKGQVKWNNQDSSPQNLRLLALMTTCRKVTPSSSEIQLLVSIPQQVSAPVALSRCLGNLGNAQCSPCVHLFGWLCSSLDAHDSTVLSKIHTQVIPYPMVPTPVSY